MSIITKVKNVDDFGKKKLQGNVYQYSHHHPRVSSNDFIIYFYPAEKQMSVYQVVNETEFYSKDGYEYCEGIMNRFSQTPQEFINMIRSQNVELSNRFEKIMNNLIKKHKK